MPAFPLFISMENKKCVIFGAGEVALRKIKILLEFNAEILVCAASFCDDLLDMKAQKKINCYEMATIDEVCLRDTLKEAFVVICATNDLAVNHYISTYCIKNGIFVNSATSASDSTFVFPSIITRGDISIGITSSGGTPSITKRIRKEIEKAVPEWVAVFQARVTEIRQFLKKEIPDQKDRADLMKQMTDYGFLHQGKIEDSVISKMIDQVKGITNNEKN